MRWIISYIVMASVGLWFALFLSLRFIAPAHSQTPPPPPTAAEIPPEFMEDGPTQPPQPPANGVGNIPPPPTGTPTAAAPAPAEAVNPAAVPAPTVEQGGIPVPGAANPEFAGDEQYNYDPTGRRDPFKPYRNYRPGPGTGAGANRADLTDPLQRWDVGRFLIMAIIWEVKNPKAMIKDPDGTTFMIGKGTKIGRNGGHVIAIREGEVLVVETIDNEGVITKEVRILELKK